MMGFGELGRMAGKMHSRPCRILSPRAPFCLTEAFICEER